MRVAMRQSMMAKAIAYHVKMVLLVSQGPDIVKHVQLVNNKPILRAVTAYLVNSVQILVPIKMKIFNVKHAQRDLVNQIKVKCATKKNKKNIKKDQKTNYLVPV